MSHKKKIQNFTQILFVFLILQTEMSIIGNIPVVSFKGINISCRRLVFFSTITSKTLVSVVLSDIIVETSVKFVVKFVTVVV